MTENSEIDCTACAKYVRAEFPRGTGCKRDADYRRIAPARQACGGKDYEAAQALADPQPARQQHDMDLCPLCAGAGELLTPNGETAWCGACAGTGENDQEGKP